MSELIVKYRPKKWEDVLGQAHVVRSIRQALERKTSRSFLLIGDPGVGKTTLARLIAREVGLNPDRDLGYYEVDGSTHTGVDDMRSIQERIQLRPLGTCPNQVICIDECQMLSKQAWHSLQKVVEEPPNGVYWVFCSTEPSKIPKSIHSRCASYTLRQVDRKDLEQFCQDVMDREEIALDAPTVGILLDYANGAPRLLLSGLARLSGSSGIKDAEKLLDGYDAEVPKDVADFCRALHSSASTWARMMSLLRKMESPSAEGIRAVVCRWFTRVAMDSSQPERALAILSAFGTPYPPVGASLHPLLLSLGELMFGEVE